MSLPEARMAMGESNGQTETGGTLSRRALLRAFTAAIATAPLLAACGESGFRPLYGTASVGGGNVEQKLAQVDISTIPGRVGQVLRNELIYQSTGGGERPTEPTYRLEIALRETVTSTLVQTDGDARSQIYNLDASFQLVRLSDKTVVLKGKSYGRAGFERFTSIFSNVRAREDAENRAARTIGEEMKTRVASFLASAA